MAAVLCYPTSGYGLNEGPLRVGSASTLDGQAAVRCPRRLKGGLLTCSRPTLNESPTAGLADQPPYHQRRLSAVMPEVLRRAVNFGSGW